MSSAWGNAFGAAFGAAWGGAAVAEPPAPPVQGGGSLSRAFIPRYEYATPQTIEIGGTHTGAHWGLAWLTVSCECQHAGANVSTMRFDQGISLQVHVRGQSRASARVRVHADPQQTLALLVMLGALDG